LSRRLEDFPDEVIEGGHMLKEVSLASNLLTFVPNDAFETLTRLTTLDMNDNMLGSLPENLGLLTDLTRWESTSSRVPVRPVF
jgi:Leucine-rich repeat (LRR) protein